MAGTHIDTDELLRRTRQPNEYAPHSTTRDHLAAAAARGWIVQDNDGNCWWADDDGHWYLQGDAATLITHTRHSATTTPAAPTDPMHAAQRHLEERYHHADHTGDWQTRWLLSALIDIADHTRRVTLPTASAHYRAEKSGPLAAAADRYQQTAFLAYAGWPDDGDDTHPTEQALATAFEHLDNVRSAIRTAAWHIASGQPLHDSEAHHMRRTARELTDWTARTTANPTPDPTP